MLREIAQEVLQCVTKLGLEQFELYSEARARLAVTTHQKITRTSKSLTCGTAISFNHQGILFKFSRNDQNIPAILKLMGIESSLPPLSDIPYLSLTSDAVVSLTKLSGDKPLFFQQTAIKYFTLSDSTGLNTGSEEFAELESSFGRVVRASIDGFWNDFSQLTQQSKRLTHVANAHWPPPAGSISILWSPQALASLIKVFLRHFESDRLLEGGSLLSQTQFPLPIRFDLIDMAYGQGDHEGTLQMETVLFGKGRPRSLACNKQSAQELGVNATGHARKSSYLKPAVPSFWRLHLIGHETVGDEMIALNNGVLVDSAEFCAMEKTIHILKSSLVHQGIVGEGMEPWKLELPILQFVQTLRLFSEKREVVGIEWEKHGNHLIADFSLPWAISNDIQTSGNGRYW